MGWESFSWITLLVSPYSRRWVVFSFFESLASHATLSRFTAFLSPLEDPNDSNGPTLPQTSKEGKEFRPFARRLPEFKFWLACSRGTAICILMTFFSIFDVPVFWPILLLYFFVLFFATMKRQIMHMYKHKYVPISFGKTKYKDAGVEKSMFGGGAAGHRSRWTN